MTEVPLLFLNESHNLFGVLHKPEGKPVKRGFVFCHPFAEEKLWTHRVYVSFARELAQEGYAVLRFDCMGHGDSDGRFEKSSVETNISDIRCAIGTLKKEVGTVEDIGLLGLRFGATLASLVAEDEPGIKWLVLWEPVINGSSYMREMLRINIATQSAVFKEVKNNSESLVQSMKNGNTVNVDGYEIGYSLYEQADRINLMASEKAFQDPTLLVHITKRKGVIAKNMEALAGLYRNCELHCALEDPFWKEIRPYYGMAEDLFKITLEWLAKK